MIGSLVKRVMKQSIALLKKLHTCFNAAKVPDAFEKLQAGKNLAIRKIPGYSEVRWTSMFSLTDVVVDRYQCILLALYNFGQDTGDHFRPAA